MKPNILVIGSATIDLTMKVERIPHPGETVLGGSFSTAPGGKGANQAVAAARFGANVVFVGCLGDDSYGREALENYRREGIDASHVRLVRDATTAVATITVDLSGQNAITVAPGANFAMRTEDVERAASLIDRADMVVLQLEIPMDCVRRAIDLAHVRGKRILLNPAPAQQLDTAMLKRVSFITPNEQETHTLTGSSVQTVEEARIAAAELRVRGAANVILTLGERGAFISTDEIEEMIPAPRVRALDATAAGDVFNGVLAVMIAEGKSLDEAVRFANVAAALSVTKMGAQPSIPRREEVERFLHREARNGFSSELT
jgi:ribokinase